MAAGTEARRSHPGLVLAGLLLVAAAGSGCATIRRSRLPHFVWPARTVIIQFNYRATPAARAGVIKKYGRELAVYGEEGVLLLTPGWWDLEILVPAMLRETCIASVTPYVLPEAVPDANGATAVVESLPLLDPMNSCYRDVMQRLNRTGEGDWKDQYYPRMGTAAFHIRFKDGVLPPRALEILNAYRLTVAIAPRTPADSYLVLMPDGLEVSIMMRQIDKEGEVDQVTPLLESDW